MHPNLYALGAIVLWASLASLGVSCAMCRPSCSPASPW
jgi:hypothetical protein